MNARESTPRTRSLPACRLSRILQPTLPNHLVGRAVAPIAKAGVFYVISVVRHRLSDVVQSAARRPPSTVHGSLIAAFCLLTTALWTPSVSAAAPVPTNKPATHPAWWFEREVIKRTDPPAASPAWPIDYPASDDFAVLNQGQLKNLATKAYAEFKDKLPGQPWTTVDTPAYKLEQLVLGWYVAYPSSPKTIGTDPFATVNQGQLKNVAAHFYDVLAAVGYVGGLGLPPDTSGFPWSTGSAYPWTPAITDDDNYATANLGQAKRLFSFDPSALPTPESPTNVQAIFTSSNVVTVSWCDNSNNESGFRIERSLDGGQTWAQIVVVAANTTSFQDDLSGYTSTNIKYRVSAGNGIGNSSSSSSGALNSNDQNNDGMDDAWVALHFPGQSYVDPNADPDEDGLTNIEESKAKTLPFNAYSDGDLVKDGEDGWPLIDQLAPKRLTVPSYAVIELSTVSNSAAKFVNDSAQVVIEEPTGTPDKKIYYRWENGAKTPIQAPSGWEIISIDGMSDKGIVAGTGKYKVSNPITAPLLIYGAIQHFIDGVAVPGAVDTYLEDSGSNETLSPSESSFDETGVFTWEGSAEILPSEVSEFNAPSGLSFYWQVEQGASNTAAKVVSNGFTNLHMSKNGTIIGSCSRVVWGMAALKYRTSEWWWNDGQEGTGPHNEQTSESAVAMRADDVYFAGMDLGGELLGNAGVRWQISTNDYQPPTKVGDIIWKIPGVSGNQIEPSMIANSGVIIGNKVEDGKQGYLKNDNSLVLFPTGKIAYSINNHNHINGGGVIWLDTKLTPLNDKVADDSPTYQMIEMTADKCDRPPNGKLNAAMQILGGTTLWHNAREYPLNSLIPSARGVTPTWSITSTPDLTDKGIIAANATKHSDSSTHAVLLVPYEFKLRNQADINKGWDPMFEQGDDAPWTIVAKNHIHGNFDVNELTKLVLPSNEIAQMFELAVADESAQLIELNDSAEPVALTQAETNIKIVGKNANPLVVNNAIIELRVASTGQVVAQMKVRVVPDLNPLSLKFYAVEDSRFLMGRPIAGYPDWSYSGSKIRSSTGVEGAMYADAQTVIERQCALPLSLAGNAEARDIPYLKPKADPTFEPYESYLDIDDQVWMLSKFQASQFNDGDIQIILIHLLNHGVFGYYYFEQDLCYMAIDNWYQTYFEGVLQPAWASIDWDLFDPENSLGEVHSAGRVCSHEIGHALWLASRPDPSEDDGSDYPGGHDYGPYPKGTVSLMIGGRKMGKWLRQEDWQRAFEQALLK